MDMEALKLVNSPSHQEVVFRGENRILKSNQGVVVRRYYNTAHLLPVLSLPFSHRSDLFALLLLLTDVLAFYGGACLPVPGIPGSGDLKL